MSTAVEKTKKQPLTVKQLIVAQSAQLEAALPKHMSTDRFVRICLTVISQNPKLQDCDAMSLLGCFIQSAQLGLEPSDALGEAYIIPYKGVATFQPGYKGLVKLVRNSGRVRRLSYQAVFSNDDFSYCYGLNPDLKHNPAQGDRGELTHVYAVAKTGPRKDDVEFCVMTTAEVEKHRQKFSKMPNGKGWRDNFEAMALKTVIIKLCKLLPKSAEINTALIAADSQTLHNVALEAGIKAPAGWIPPDEPSADATTIPLVLANPEPSDHEENAVTDESIAKAELDKKALDDALTRYANLCTTVGSAGGSVGEILQMPDPAAILKLAESSRIDAASDVLNDWITKQAKK
jgi:recombination protein RecT